MAGALGPLLLLTSEDAEVLLLAAAAGFEICMQTAPAAFAPHAAPYLRECAQRLALMHTDSGAAESPEAMAIIPTAAAGKARSAPRSPPLRPSPRCLPWRCIVRATMGDASVSAGARCGDDAQMMALLLMRVALHCGPDAFGELFDGDATRESRALAVVVELGSLRHLEDVVAFSGGPLRPQEERHLFALGTCALLRAGRPAALGVVGG